jgi:hypothetical protein
MAWLITSVLILGTFREAVDFLSTIHVVGHAVHHVCHGGLVVGLAETGALKIPNI